MSLLTTCLYDHTVQTTSTIFLSLKPLLWFPNAFSWNVCIVYCITFSHYDDAGKNATSSNTKFKQYCSNCSMLQAALNSINQYETHFPVSVSISPSKNMLLKKGILQVTQETSNTQFQMPSSKQFRKSYFPKYCQYYWHFLKTKQKRTQCFCSISSSLLLKEQHFQPHP